MLLVQSVFPPPSPSVLSLADIASDYENMAASKQRRKEQAPSFYGKVDEAKHMISSQITSLISVAILGLVLTFYADPSWVILILSVYAVLLGIMILPMLAQASQRLSDNPWFSHLVNVILMTFVFFCVAYLLELIKGFWTNTNTTTLQIALVAIFFVMALVVVMAELDQRFARHQVYTHETGTKFAHWMQNARVRENNLHFLQTLSNKSHAATQRMN